jgi:hypothetical protein
MIVSINISILRTLRSTAIVFPAIILLSVNLIANAQGVGSSRGFLVVTAIIHSGPSLFPAGEQRNGKIIKLHLESNDSTGAMTVVTDQDGVFRFNSLRKKLLGRG